MNREAHILGSRGVPAAHSGFEYLAEHLSLYLVANGWKVTVYCQLPGPGDIYEDEWRGVHRVNIPIENSGALGTIIFDWKATLISMKRPGTMLTLGYNTAVFGLLYRLRGIRNVINMDGIEWRRGKWGPAAKAWFYLNDWAGCWLGNQLIADHPEIARHLESRVSPAKITMITYGADQVLHPEAEVLNAFNLTPGCYYILIARPVPENSILEVVTAFSRIETDRRLLILGDYSPDNDYQRRVLEAAGPNVDFPGAIFDARTVGALRYYARLYIHGHTVGGTNPSLVEALAAGSAVLAHDNRFNRWVAGDGAAYFSGIDDCEATMRRLLEQDAQIEKMSEASTTRHRESFQWPEILRRYEATL